MRDGLGRFGESWAVGHLTRLGYDILARNVRYRVGEIDIVALDGETLVFVEVKCRRSSQYGLPEESITAERFARLTAAIHSYLVEQSLEPDDMRVDVVAIEVGRNGAVKDYRVLRGVESP